MKVDHIGIAVHSIDEAATLFVQLFQCAAAEREDLPVERVRVVFLNAGRAQIELLQPLGDEGPLATFLRTRGEGLHHIAFEVSDIERSLSVAQAAGYRPLDPHPRPGSRGRMIAFLHPATTHGVLIELVQATISP